MITLALIGFAAIGLAVLVYLGIATAIVSWFLFPFLLFIGGCVVFAKLNMIAGVVIIGIAIFLDNKTRTESAPH
jgi:hypothetical protein